MEEPHRWSKLGGACQTGEVQPWYGGFEVGGEYRCLLYGAQLRKDALAEKGQRPEREPVAGRSNDVISSELAEFSVQPLQMQQDSLTVILCAAH
jgi:hypothetical protein